MPVQISNGGPAHTIYPQSRLVPDTMVSRGVEHMLSDVHVLLNSRKPMNLSLFCLGNTAAAVMVGSAGSAVESCHKAEVESNSKGSSLNIVTMSVTLEARN